MSAVFVAVALILHIPSGQIRVGALPHPFETREQCEAAAAKAAKREPPPGLMMLASECLPIGASS